MAKFNLESVVKYFRLVRFAHTIFALPFAMIGFALALSLSESSFSIKLLILVLIAMVTARNAAMGFNRYLDRDIDSINPRTKLREIPSGMLSPRAVLAFVVVNSFLFVITTLLINPLCFFLSFPALAVILGYSYMKRVTSYSHYVLGLALAIAPTGAFLSVTGYFHPAPIILSGIVILWVSGFDIIYALEDEEFDSNHGLRSVPQFFGKRWGLFISSVSHFLIVPLLILFYFSVNLFINSLLGWIYIVGALVFLALLLWQHLIVSHKDLSRIDAAFFTLNGIASVLFAVFVIIDLLI